MDHFSTSTLLNYGACFETASHNELPSFGSSSTNLFGSSDYHHGDFSMMQNNQPMSSYQNYYGQTLDNLQPPNPSGFLADSADFQMNLFDSSTPYSLFPAPSVPPAPRKSTEPQKSNLKTNQKSANNSTAVFYPSTPVSAATTECYQKLNSNFPPASNCSSSATNLPLSSSTTNSLANFNMSTIFPEMNDKVR
ncbi:hypothetical protein LSTR_LSTR015652 [Laodelphax striatellus]|uniref:Uncharacterized protein n=1 Tax=Laodelphax striatellus TaxID=195883 RepID=A0A482XB05_LAOST|nr:hypothetical protein LSTR_LSTR015652 [Laodelphax striatellus]